MPLRRKVSLALIGAGGIGRKWLAAISQVPSAELRLIMDKDLKKAEELAGGVNGCRATNNLEQVLKSGEVKAVIVATPNKFLAEISRESLLAHKHVLCEKPGAINMSQLGSLRGALEKTGHRYMIGFNHRFHPAYLTAKKLYDQGLIGQILFIRARYGFGGRPGYHQEWRFKKSVSGGGEVIDQGVHLIDLARWFLGDFKEVKGFSENLFWGGEVEDNGFLLLRTQTGKIASLHVSWTNWKWICSFEIVGSRGYLYIDGLDQRYGGPERLIIGKRDSNFRRPPKERIKVFSHEQAEDSFARELTEFLNAIAEGRDPVPSLDDAGEVLKIVKKIYEQK